MAVPGADKPWSEIEFEDFGSNFVNFISTIIASRMVMKEKEVGLLKRYSYEVILDDLKEIRRLTDSKEPARVDDDGWVLVEPEEKSLLVKLGLIEGQMVEEPKKRGRPRKNPPIEESEKRPRGRPRKNP